MFFEKKKKKKKTLKNDQFFSCDQYFCPTNNFTRLKLTPTKNFYQLFFLLNKNHITEILKKLSDILYQEEAVMSLKLINQNQSVTRRLIRQNWSVTLTVVVKKKTSTLRLILMNQLSWSSIKFLFLKYNFKELFA